MDQNEIYEQNYEQNYEQYYQPNQVPDPKKDDKLPNILCGISLACEIVPYILSGIVMYIASALTEGDTSSVYEIITSIMGTLNVLFMIAGLVLMIYVRVKYPKNIFGKVLMWLYIIMGIIGIIVFIVYMVFIMVTCVACFSCLSDMPG